MTPGASPIGTPGPGSLHPLALSGCAHGSASVMPSSSPWPGVKGGDFCSDSLGISEQFIAVSQTD